MESWSGTFDGFSLIADLTKSEGEQQTLQVYVQRGRNTWHGSSTSQGSDPNETRNGSNCAATRGTNPSLRAFTLLRTATSKERSVRIVDDIRPRLVISSAWGTEFGIKGVYLPIAEVHLTVVEPSDFYAALFHQVANNRDKEQKLHTSLVELESETDVLHRTDKSLTMLLPKRREQLVSAMTKALNDFKSECQTSV